MSAYNMYRDRTVYLAGVFDGEGCIALQVTTAKKRETYRVRLHVTMSHTGALKLFKEAFGGSYYKNPPHPAGNRKQCWTWHISGLSAIAAAKEMAPFIVVKKDEFDALLCRSNLFQGRSGQRLSNSNVAQRKELFHTLRALKRVEHVPTGTSPNV
jgi:hypothetical protein